MTRKRLTVREVVRADESALVSAHRVLRGIFPRSELVHLSEWRETLREREAALWVDIRWHLVIAESGGKVVGVATGTYLGNVNTGIIGYLAVASKTRGGGVGPRLRRHLRRLFERDARAVLGKPLRAIVGEVHRNNPWLRSLNRRPNLLALDFPYLQPRIHTSGVPVPMVMYCESLGKVRRRMPASELRRLLATIWRRVYRIPRPMRDARFRRMLAPLKGRRWVGGITTEGVKSTRRVNS